MMNKKENLKRRYVLFLFLISLLLNLYGIVRLNPYINLDEVSIGYSSWCLGHYGVDRYMHSFPVYLQNAHGGQSILYAYLILPGILLFGLNTYTVRLPMAILSSLGVIPLYDMLKRTSKKQQIFTSVLYIISPVIISLGRMGIDCNIMIPLTILMLHQIDKAISTGENKYFISGAVLCVTELYSYALAYLIIPIFLILLLIILIYTKKITKTQFILVAIIIILGGFPLLLNILTQYVIKKNWTFGFVDFWVLHRNTQSELTDYSAKAILEFIQNSIYTSHLLLIDNRDCSAPYGRFYSNFYIISIPFILYGFFLSVKRFPTQIKEKDFSGSFLFFLFSISIFISLSPIKHMGGYRINMIFPSLVVLAGVGVSEFCNTNKKTKTVYGIYLIETILFFGLYYGINLPYEAWQNKNFSQSAISFSEELKFAKEKSREKSNIYIVNGYANWSYIPYSLGGLDPNIVKYIDDSDGYYVHDVNNIKITNPETIKDEDIFIVSKEYIDPYYTNNIDFDGYNCKDFQYYTVYWKK